MKYPHLWWWTPPAGHEDQPLIDWYIEQIAINLTRLVYNRAEDRGDKQTTNRMQVIFTAGAIAEHHAASTEMEQESGRG